MLSRRFRPRISGTRRSASLPGLLVVGGVRSVGRRRVLSRGLQPGAAAVEVDGFEEALEEGVEGGFGLQGVFDGVGVGGVGVVFDDFDVGGTGGDIVGGVLGEGLDFVDGVGDGGDGAVLANGFEVIEAGDDGTGGGDGDFDDAGGGVGDVFVTGGAADVADFGEVVSAVVEFGLPEGGVAFLFTGSRGSGGGGLGGEMGNEGEGGEGEAGEEGGFHR